MKDLETEVKNIQKEYDEYWKEKARAAGWSPPVPSGLRAITRCPSGFCENGMSHRTMESVEECPVCHGTGTITRPLTPAETNELAEFLFTDVVDSMTLKIVAKVILVEENDANL